MKKSEKTNNTIVIAACTGFEARVLYRSGIIENLLKQNVEIVILVPNADEQYIRDEFGRNNVVVEKLDIESYQSYYALSRLQQTLRIIRLYSFNWLKTPLRWSKNRVDNFRQFLNKISLFRKLIFCSTVWISRRSLLIRKAINKLEYHYFTPETHQHIFDQYKPALVITCSPGHNIWDAYLLRESRKNNVKTISIMSSWDKPNTGGYPGARPEYIVVWSDFMKMEMVCINDFSWNSIYVGGAPQFDIYFNDDKLISRKGILNKYSLNENKKIILLGTCSPSFYSNYYIIKYLAECIGRGKFQHPCQLLVRMHPLYFRKRYHSDNMLSDERKRILKLADEYDFVSYAIPEIRSERLQFDMGPNDQIELASIIDNADVVINILSTMNLEVMLRNKPLVNIAFDPPQEYLSNGYIPFEVVCSWSHNARSIESGAFLNAKSQDELIEMVNYLLHNPSHNQIEREKFIKQECIPDGRSASRIAAFILSQMQR